MSLALEPTVDIASIATQKISLLIEMTHINFSFGNVFYSRLMHKNCIRLVLVNKISAFFSWLQIFCYFEIVNDYVLLIKGCF